MCCEKCWTDKNRKPENDLKDNPSTIYPIPDEVTGFGGWSVGKPYQENFGIMWDNPYNSSSPGSYIGMTENQIVDYLEKNKNLNSDNQGGSLYSPNNLTAQQIQNLINEKTKNAMHNPTKLTPQTIMDAVEKLQGENPKPISYTKQNEIVIPLKILMDKNEFNMPHYKREGDAAMDLYASEDVFIPVGEIAMIPTGFSVKIPEGYEGQIRARSGLAVQGLFVVNGPGTIDSNFLGEWKIILGNFNNKLDTDGEFKRPGFQVKKGDRIAQVAFAPVTSATFHIVEKLEQTNRGEQGFGSSGLR